MVSAHKDFTTPIEISLFRRSNLIIFIENATKVLKQRVAYRNLAVHFSVNLPGRPDLPAKVVKTELK